MAILLDKINVKLVNNYGAILNSEGPRVRIMSLAPNTSIV